MILQSQEWVIIVISQLCGYNIFDFLILKMNTDISLLSVYLRNNSLNDQAIGRPMKYNEMDTC